MATITNCELTVSTHRLTQPLGFKGGYLKELWHPVCKISTDIGLTGYGVGVQSVLWSDAAIFNSHTVAGGNALMLAITDFALTELIGSAAGRDPIAAMRELQPRVFAYAERIVGRSDPALTFSLNALVAVDFALWQIWSAINAAHSFDQLAAAFCPALNRRTEAMALIPLISYNTPDAEIRGALEAGSPVLKIKLGHAQNMLERDCARLLAIHKIAATYSTPYTESGHPLYYLDMNGRYTDRAELDELLAFAGREGIAERILLIEEPFPEHSGINAAGVPVLVAADESAHSVADTRRMIEECNYSSVALKPIAKTLSESLEIYNYLAKLGVPAFCADLTVPPVMLDWNLNVAARLPLLPGLKIGLIESNGAQNYADWSQLVAAYPGYAELLDPQQPGILRLSDEWYGNCEAFRIPVRYAALFN